MLIEIVSEVLGNETIKECAENILLEVPTIDATAEVISDLPDRLVELCFIRSCQYLSHPSMWRKSEQV